LKYLKFLSVSVIIALTAMVYGQSDTLIKTKLKARPVYITISDFESLDTTFKNFDTTLNGEQHINKLRKQNLNYQDLGLLGTPMQTLYLMSTKSAGFNFGFNTMDNWIYGLSKTEEKLIVAPAPYTQIKYAQGEKELIFLELLHTQNITQRWNIGLDYRRLKTNNYLFNMDGITENKVRITSIYNLNLFTNYHTKSDRYYLLASVIFNKYTLTETGGLKFPLSFDTTSGKRRVFNNPLVNASNFFVNPKLSISNYFRFGKTKFNTIIKNSMVIDTLSFEFKPKGYFYHTIDLSRSVFSYKHPDADTPYYQSPLIGPIHDSIYLNELTNKVGLVLKTNYKQFSNLIKFGVDFSNYGVFNSNYGKVPLSNLSINGKIMSKLGSKQGEIELNGKGQYFISGYNVNDFLLNAEIRLLSQDKFNLTGRINSQRHAADYFQNSGYTTPIQWDQVLNPTLRNGIEASFEWLPKQLKAGMNAVNFKNYNIYYFDKAPSGIDFNYLHLFMSHSFHLGKVNWSNRINFQNTSQVFHLPKWSLAGGVYYQTHLFKKNMLARFGVDYFWFSSYFADEYNPYLRQFVWQNKTKIGNYPYFDLYMSAQVQTMNIFIKFEHINQGISGNRYYSTPLYPNTPRFFRFGINWRLFN
jgi:hypothetical protein